MAGANRGCHPRPASEHHEVEDSNDGSTDGYLGGADQITKPDGATVGDAEILAGGPAGWHLAQCRRLRRGRGESDAVLAAIGGAMAESLDRRDGSWHQRRIPSPLIARTPRRKAAREAFNQAFMHCCFAV